MERERSGFDEEMLAMCITVAYQLPVEKVLVLHKVV
jgi:hypothetical protein